MNIINLRIEGVRGAQAKLHAIKLPGTNHYVFISNETEVLRELRAFLEGLPSP